MSRGDRFAAHLHAHEIVAASASKLFEVGVSADVAVKALTDKVTALLAWLAKYVGAGHAGPRDLVMGPNHQGPATQVLVEEVVDIEESIWAPQYGLKGQLDATLRVSCSSMGPPQRSGAGSRSWQGQTAPPVAAPEQGPGTAWSRDSLVPFEYKSGKPHFSHRAQLSLYFLLLDDRYGEATAAPGSSSSAAAAPGPAAAGAGHSGDLGLLWNSGDSANMHAVKRAQHELAALMMHRNRLAAHLVGKQRLPPTMLRNERQCGTCFAATYCALVHKALEGGDEASSGMRPQQWSGLTSHLGPSHGQFLRHWLGLVELEDSAAREGRSALWAVPGRQRELQGSCLADLQLQAYLGHVGSGAAKRYLYSFTRHPPTSLVPPTPVGDSSKSSSSSLQPPSGPAQAVQPALPHLDTLGTYSRGPALTTPSQHSQPSSYGAPTAPPMSLTPSSFLAASAFAVGDMALLGMEGRHVNVARVVVHAATQDTLVLAAKKEIRMMEPYLRQPQSEGLPPLPTQQGTAQPPCAANRAVLPSAAAVLWRLDKDEAAAGVTQQRTNLLMLMEAASGQVARLRELVVDLAPPPHVLVNHLNSEQQAAVQAVLQMQDYTLILGMPGTGKTSTTVCAIQAMVAAGRSVLLTAYTNSAVDNICLKLAAAAVQFVRLPGSSLDAVHPGVRGHTPGGERYPAGNSAEGLTQLAADVKVVAVTCLGVRHPLLARRSFDVCVLDEASQVALPASLGPLALASSFVLVGDHHQLPPLVTNPAAAAQGMSESLFKRLSEAHPQAVVQLCRQYRMAEEIQALSNSLVYSGSLRCASQAVATARLHLPAWSHQLSELPAGQPLPAWLKQALDPERRVVFLDTADSCHDSCSQEAVSNLGEAQIIARLVQSLLLCGAQPADLGLVSPFRAQVSLLQRKVAEVQSALALDHPAPSPAAGSTASTPASGIEVLTIDKYQGRDKPCILLSFVRSNPERQAGRLLANLQRINVALTRAQHKLVMVGSSVTLRAAPMMCQLLNLVQEKGWLVPVVNGV
ncbi:P-loop containing nucleoside triphosphate hydrolase protein [Haematococcus lacustris]